MTTNAFSGSHPYKNSQETTVLFGVIFINEQFGSVVVTISVEHLEGTWHSCIRIVTLAVVHNSDMSRTKFSGHAYLRKVDVSSDQNLSQVQVSAKIRINKQRTPPTPPSPTIVIALNENVMEHVDNVRDEMNAVGSRKQHRAFKLYNRAIEEGDHVKAMNTLALLLKEGAERVPTNVHRAVELYNRAIDEGDNVDAMTDLAVLLHHGTNALEADPSRALLYTSVIETTGSADAMYSLALLLHFGANGVSKEPVRAHELYTRAMNEAGTGISYFNVRHLVDSGVEGLPAQPDRRVKLRTRGAAMYSLSKLLRDGADGIPADPVRAEQLLQSARSETQMSVLDVKS